MKKIFAFLAIAMLSFCLVACTGGTQPGDQPGEGDKGKTIELTYSGTASDKEFNQGLFELFKADRKAKGDKNTYVINYFECGPDAIDSTVLDWAAPNAPDVYEYASDKINILLGKGALAKVTGSYKQYIVDEMTEFATDLVTVGGDTYAYPYTGDNTYYLQYDKSVFSAEDVVTIEGLLDAAQEKGYQIGYELETPFWGAAAMFTFGADFDLEYDEDGNLLDIVSDFDGENGLKAAKAIYKIMKHPAWVNASDVSGAGSEVKAVIGGTWNIQRFKDEIWGDNYACATMPTVTIDGETATLGCFLGGKAFGINPQVSQGDTDRFVAANELAKFLSGHECQTLRYEESSIFPCIASAQNHKNMQDDANVAVLKAQYEYARAQSAIPQSFWDAPTALVGGIKDGTITEDMLQEACNTFNEAVKAELNK